MRGIDTKRAADILGLKSTTTVNKLVKLGKLRDIGKPKKEGGTGIHHMKFVAAEVKEFAKTYRPRKRRGAEQLLAAASEVKISKSDSPMGRISRLETILAEVRADVKALLKVWS